MSSNKLAVKHHRNCKIRHPSVCFRGKQSHVTQDLHSNSGLESRILNGPLKQNVHVITQTKQSRLEMHETVSMRCSNVNYLQISRSTPLRMSNRQEYLSMNSFCIVKFDLLKKWTQRIFRININIAFRWSRGLTYFDLRDLTRGIAWPIRLVLFLSRVCIVLLDISDR